MKGPFRARITERVRKAKNIPLKNAFLMMLLVLTISSASAADLTLTHINSTYWSVGIVNATNLFSYEVIIEYENFTQATFAPIIHQSFFLSLPGETAQQCTQYANGSRSGEAWNNGTAVEDYHVFDDDDNFHGTYCFCSGPESPQCQPDSYVYASRLDNQHHAINGSGELFNFTFNGYARLKHGLFISTTDIDTLADGEEITYNYTSCWPRLDQDWIVNCADQCVFNSDIATPKNVSFIGAGSAYFLAGLKMLNPNSKIYKEDGCRIELKEHSTISWQ